MEGKAREENVVCVEDGWMVGDQAVAQAGRLRSFAREGLQIGGGWRSPTQSSCD